MSQIIRQTWVPTTVLLALTVAVGLWMIGGVLVAYSALTAIVLTPLLWIRLVGTSDRGAGGRGAATGALVAAIAQLLPTLFTVTWFALEGGGQDGMGMGLGIVGLIFVVGVACVAAVIGSVLGAVLGIAKRPTGRSASVTRGAA